MERTMAHRDRGGRTAKNRKAENRIATVRRFNRFYTLQIGVLRKTYLDSPYSLGEARVLYEIASGHSHTASEIGRALDLDAGYLSRVLHTFEKRDLIERKASARDGRQSHLALSPRGRAVYAPLEARSQRQIGAMLIGLKPAEQSQLISAMTTIETLLGAAAEQKPEATRDYVLRAPVPGDAARLVRLRDLRQLAARLELRVTELARRSLGIDAADSTTGGPRPCGSKTTTRPRS